MDVGGSRTRGAPWGARPDVVLVERLVPGVRKCVENPY